MYQQDLVSKLYDKEFRAQLVEDPKAALAAMSAEQSEPAYAPDGNVEYKVVKNTKDTIYVVLENPGAEIDLDNIQAAGVTSSISTGGTAGTATLTVSSVGSLGTIGSAV